VALLEAQGVARLIEGPPEATLIEDVSLTLDPGEFVAVTGPSGSGKSSLLYLLGLLDRPSRGRILVDGLDVLQLAPRALARLRLQRFGFVFQFHFLLPEFTARQNLLIPMRQLGRLDERGMQARVEELLRSLGLSEARDKYPDQLSGGMRQRVAIARALANDPEVILADEPTGNLDTRNAAAVFEILSGLAASGRRAVLVVTHDPTLAARAGRRITVVDGRIAQDSSQVPAAAA